MSASRQFARNQLKQKQGNNKIQRAWERAQIKKFGFKLWWEMRVNCDSKKRRAITLIG